MRSQKLRRNWHRALRLFLCLTMLTNRHKLKSKRKTKHVLQKRSTNSVIYGSREVTISKIVDFDSSPNKNGGTNNTGASFLYVMNARVLKAYGHGTPMNLNISWSPRTLCASWRNKENIVVKESASHQKPINFFRRAREAAQRCSTMCV